jgi:S1-C subfamily serine protease
MTGYEPPVRHRQTMVWPAYGGYWPPYPPPPPPPPPPRRSGVGIVIGLIAVIAVLCAGGLLAWGTWQVSSGAGGSDVLSRGVTRPTTAAPKVPSGSTDASSIAAAIDPSVVDIVSTLGLQRANAAGTGIVLTSNGEILTNNHVINGATAISVTDVGNGRTYQADVVGYDRTEDLAVIQLRNASGLSTAPLGDSSAVSVGDPIVAIGNAGGRGGTPAAVTGSVTGLDETITASDENGNDSQQLSGLIRVAADVQPGDSGGPLVNASAQVVGIDTAATASYQFQAGKGEGFAIPINHALTVAKQIERGQSSDTVHIGQTAFLGVAVSDGTGGSGVVITQIVAGSPAESAGLVKGDQIISLDGTSVDSPTKLTNLLTRYHPGDQITVGVTSQAGKTRSVPVRLATGPAA